MLRAIIFDFDGLMVDTEMPAWESWTQIYREYGVTLSLDTWGLVVGGSGESFNPCTHLASRTTVAFDCADLIARRRKLKNELAATQPLLPGVADLIHSAAQAGVLLAVASGSPHDWVDGHLARLGVQDFFAAVACADDVARVKPFPDLYQLALERLGVLPHEAMAIEDSPHGITAAQRAGLFCVAVPNAITMQLDTNHANLQVSSLAALTLPDLVRTLAAP